METSEKPIMLLDVDGVIFPFSSNTGWSAKPCKVNIYINDGKVLTERYAVRLVKSLRAIIDSGAVEVVWATSWIEKVDKLERIFKFPPLRRAFEHCPPGSIPVKTLAAWEALETGRRLIWADDAAIPKWGPLYDELIRENRSLLISPTPNRGLQPAHVIEICKFIGIEVPVV